jgi:hypothetical protein
VDCLTDSTARRTDGWAVERWLDTRTRIWLTTRLHYARDVELVLIPHLGHYRLNGFDGPLLCAVFVFSRLSRRAPEGRTGNSGNEADEDGKE